MEKFRDIISTQTDSIEEVEPKDSIELSPVMGDAYRQMKKTGKIRDDIINQAIKNVKEKTGPVTTKLRYTPAQTKMHLNESLFEDFND